ncbi:MAG: PDC sensor domain-containing protein [Gammaproteobacteria bacterium]|nr:PDC sensor domain-containing protein [Gammaproteobacteria bacterium]
MAAMSYISVIERYHEYCGAIHELLASILSGILEEKLFTDSEFQQKTIDYLDDTYPFVNTLYTLDNEGTQTSNNIVPANSNIPNNKGLGKDRSQRPYYLMARQNDGIIVTEPYLSAVSRNLCISAAIKRKNQNDDTQGYIVVDIDLPETLEFLMGDTPRRRFEPLFKAIYTFISIGLFAVVGILLYSATTELLSLFSESASFEDYYLKPFGVIIFLTLALAIFDLGKTTLEEEVLMHKDIFRHSSTRRTITRFIAAILIAISIESLLLMFKGALGDGQHLMEAVWMMFAAIGLMVGLGIYVYLGSKAEAILNSQRQQRLHTKRS